MLNNLETQLYLDVDFNKGTTLFIVSNIYNVRNGYPQRKGISVGHI
jgi:hypothetical protein